MFKVEIHTEELDEYVKDLEKEFKSVKGAKAGWYEGKKYPNGLEIAKNALIQEYGTDKIPARPFMRRTINRNQEKWKKYLEENFDLELDNNTTLEQVMKQISVIMAGDMKKSIDSNIPPPNSPETIKRKGSSHTLIDTGTLKNSIRAQVIKK